MGERINMLQRLDRCVRLYCDEIRKQCQKHRKWAYRRFGEWNYPAMASVCVFKGDFFKAFSHRMSTNECSPIFFRIIQKYGKIGQIPKNVSNAKYPIGNCAEQHAANKVLKRTNNDVRPNIQYSIAMRPRTNEPFDACAFCKIILPNAR